MDGEAECARCGAGVADAAFCPWCGLELAGESAARMRELAGALDALDRELGGLWQRRAEVAFELDDARGASVRDAPGAPFSPTPLPRDRQGEWSIAGVRGLLLWLGVALLALSAVTFTVVTWSQLSDGGRAALLAGATVAVTALAFACRRRLPATAEALSALAIAIAAIDWHALRRAGVGAHVSGTAWWSIGAVVLGGMAALVARFVSRRIGHAGMAVAFPTGAVLVVATFAHAPWSVALGLATVALVIVVAFVVLRHAIERLTVVLGSVEAALVWAASAVAAMIAVGDTHEFPDTLAPAAVMLVVALAPGAATVVRTRASRRPGVLPALAVGALLGALLVPWWRSVDTHALLLVAAVLGTATVGLAAVVPASWRAGTRTAGAAFIAPGLAVALGPSLVATLGPLGWLSSVWQGDLDAAARTVVAGRTSTTTLHASWATVAALAAAAIAFVLARASSTPAGRRAASPARAAGAGGLALLAANLAVFTGAATVRDACIAASALAVCVLILSALLSGVDEKIAFVTLALASIPAAPALGWATTTPAASVSTLAAVLVAATVAVTLDRARPLRAAHAALVTAVAITLAGVATSAAGGDRGVAGFAIACVAIAAGAVGLRQFVSGGSAVESVGAAGLVCGLAIAAPSPVWFATSLTATAVLLTLGALRSDRHVYAPAALAAALAATWSWLGTAHVTLVEDYTLPAAGAAFALGIVTRTTRPASSWTTVAAAIVLGLGPTAALGIAHDDTTRIVIAAIAAFLVLLVGARGRLQAPLVLGAATLVALALDLVAPEAARLPRWTVLAAAGALLLWAGATFERRREDLRRETRTLLGFR